jgi:sporadic carbohydrate cluster protein (TIGR04323 family)
MKKKYAGYVNLKPLNGVIYPSSIQNIMMKNFIENELKGIFHLAPTEFLQAKYSIVLRTLLSNQTQVEGIVLLSTFLLPQKYQERKKIYQLLKKTKKKMFFIIDGLSIKNNNDLDLVEDFMIFNSDHFVKTKTGLNKYESQFMKKYKDVSLV